MNRNLQLDSPYLLGFEHTRTLIERAARAGQDGYPPYNIEALGDDRLRLTLALAGFCAPELNVSVEDRQLAVTGRREVSGEAEREFLHRGIAARSFCRTFVLADGMEVADALFEHGLLHIDVVRPPREPARHVEIRTPE